MPRTSPLPWCGTWLKVVTCSRSEPIIFLGETGTGKTHLATGLAVEACRQRKRVRFTTAAEMVNELTEAKNNSELNRVTYGGGRDTS